MTNFVISKAFYISKFVESQAYGLFYLSTTIYISLSHVNELLKISISDLTIKLVLVKRNNDSTNFVNSIIKARFL